jgi:hypothetical protein
MTYKYNIILASLMFVGLSSTSMLASDNVQVETYKSNPFEHTHKTETKSKSAIKSPSGFAHEEKMSQNSRTQKAAVESARSKKISEDDINKAIKEHEKLTNDFNDFKDTPFEILKGGFVVFDHLI